MQPTCMLAPSNSIIFAYHCRRGAMGKQQQGLWRSNRVMCSGAMATAIQEVVRATGRETHTPSLERERETGMNGGIMRGVWKAEGGQGFCFEIMMLLF